MISPDAAWPVAELTLLGDGQKVRRRGVRGVEERFRLKPRTYTLAVDAGDGWDTGDGAWSIVFDTMKWPVILNS